MLGDLDEIEAIAEIEEYFAVQFSESEMECVRTVGDLFVLVCHRLANADKDLVWKKLTSVLSAYSRTSPEEMKPSMMFFDRIYD